MVRPMDLNESHVNELVDVLCERGGTSVGNGNPGNIQFHTWVELFRKDYLRSLKADKVKISARIVAMVESCGGRFVEFDTVSQRWIPMNDQKAMDTTSQALQKLSPVVPIPRGEVTMIWPSTKAAIENHNNNTHKYHETFFQLWKSPAILQRTQELLGARSTPSSTTLSDSSSPPRPPSELQLPPSSSSTTVTVEAAKTILGPGPPIPMEPQESFRFIPLSTTTTTTKPNKQKPITTSTSITDRYEYIEVDDDDDDDDDDHNRVEDPSKVTRHHDSEDHKKRPSPFFTDRTIDNHRIRATTLALDDSFDSSSEDEDDNNDGMNVPWKKYRNGGNNSRKRIRGPPNGLMVDLHDLVVVGKNMTRHGKSKQPQHDNDNDDDERIVSKSRYAAWHDSSEFMAMGIVDSSTFLSEYMKETGTNTPSSKKKRSTTKHHHHYQQQKQQQPSQHPHKHAPKHAPKQQLFGPGQPVIFGDSVTT